MDFIKIIAILLLTTIIFSCEEQDPCAEKLENGINPKPITEEADAWIENEISGEVEYISLNGNSMVLDLETNEADSIDVQCPDIIHEQHLYFYKFPEPYYIIARERSWKLQVRASENRSDYSYDFIGEIDGIGNLYLDVKKVDQLNFDNASFSDLLLLRHKPVDEFLVDSIYFQRGSGLVSFQYADETWYRL